jgi:hypothetical protein
MSEHTIYLDDLVDRFNFTLTSEGEDATFPTDAEVVLDLHWHAAEPDVGVGEHAEVTGETFFFAGERFSDQGAFVDALYAIIGGWIEEGRDEIDAKLSTIIDEEELLND